ncbi:MAG TPA: ABC transporter ATP-binding protein [Anaerolineales bacterium]|nr:ABC transporter ATP-binding protein [Anaerolineales bacterium]
MSEAVIQVRNLGKRYRIGGRQEAYGTLRDAISSAAIAPLRWLNNQRHNDRPQEFWALRNISFEVKPGEVLGIIGRNGAGKSTLLKILSRVTYPTEGRADIHGRVGSLLEVGTGFHPELTGRENIFLNGAVLGMKRAEIQRKFDEILAFAEIEQFLDTPVKRYSSGMYTRLAFAVAAHLEPDILIVDEVLAVGDAAFQKKCLGKIGNEAKNGRTVLFVSHNMVALQSLCNRVIRIHKGQVVDEGQPALVISNYLQASLMGLTEQVWDDPETAPGNHKVRIHRVCVRREGGEASDLITMRTPIVMEFEFWNLIQDAYLEPNIQLISQHGIVAFASSPTEEAGWHRRPSPIGLFRCKCYIPGDLLITGQYHVMFSIIKDSHYIAYQQEDILAFDVQDAAELRAGWYGEMVGVVRPLLKWSTEFVENESNIVFGAEEPTSDIPERI